MASAEQLASIPSAAERRDELIARIYSDEDLAVLLRFIRLAPDDNFRLAAVEVRSPHERTLLLEWLEQHLPKRHFVEVSLRSLAGISVQEELKSQLDVMAPRPEGFVLVLTELEEMQGLLPNETPRIFAQLNVQRDLLVRDLPVPILLCSTPYALLRLRTVAPDFCDYFRTLVRVSENAPKSLVGPQDLADWSPPRLQTLSEPEWPALLRDADLAIVRWQMDHARDLIATFRLTEGSEAWEPEAMLLEAAMMDAREGRIASLAVLRKLRVRSDLTSRPLTFAKVLRALEGQNSTGNGAAKAVPERSLAAQRMGTLSALARAESLVATGTSLRLQGHLDQAAASFQQALAELDAARDIEPGVREHLIAMGQQSIVNIRIQRGDLAGALRTLQKEVLPVFQRFGDALSQAKAEGQIADILMAGGQLDEALRIRQEEQVPVFEKLGETGWLAVTQSRIADILIARGQLDEALQIQREAVLPVFEKLGDVDKLAKTQGNIANILAAQGQLDEALKIEREAVLPVVVRLGDVRGRLYCEVRIAIILSKLPDPTPERTQEIAHLLSTAYDDARRLRIPEANQILAFARQNGIILASDGVA